MSRLLRAGSVGLALALCAACATTNITNRKVANEQIARPDRLIVHDFAITPAEVPAESALADDPAPSKPLSAEELAAAHELADAVAKQLVSRIDEMGVHAVRADGEPPPRTGDVVLRGAFLSIDEGSTVKRLAVGFGYGAAELRTHVEGFLMTENGLHRLGSGDVSSGGAGKTPGMAVPLVVTLATANPIGLVVGGAVKGVGELSGHDTIEGAGKRTADAIADELKKRFEAQGWIAPD